jgi:hypothetical protein
LEEKLTAVNQTEMSPLADFLLPNLSQFVAVREAVVGL